MRFPDDKSVPQWTQRFQVKGSNIALFLIVLLRVSTASSSTAVPKDLPYLGVTLLTNHNSAAVDSDYFKCERRLKVSDPSGLQIVMSVAPGSPAAAAGIRPCDVILSYDHHLPPVTLLSFRMTNSFADVAALVPKTPIGTVVEMQIVRGREVLSLYVRMGSRKETAEEMHVRISREEADHRAAHAKEEENKRVTGAKDKEARQVAEAKEVEEAQKDDADAVARREEEQTRKVKEVAERPLTGRSRQFSFARILLRQILWFSVVGCLLALAVGIWRVWVRYLPRTAAKLNQVPLIARFPVVGDPKQ
jgi:PDZ domain